MTKTKLALLVFALALPAIAQDDVGPMYHGKTKVNHNFYLATAGNSTYNIVQKSGFRSAILSVAMRCASGTIKGSLAIDGTDVTGCSGNGTAGAGALSVSSTESESSCYSNNELLPGQTLSVVTDTNSTCLGLSVSVDALR